MDAEDAERVDEQIKLLQSKQQVIQHATNNQIKILNATIGYQELRRNVEYNEDRITNVMKRIQKQIINAIRREDINEHLLLLNTMTDLINDIIDLYPHEKRRYINSFITYRNHNNRTKRSNHFTNKRITFPL